MREELERRAGKNEQTVLEYAVEWLENGQTLVELAQAMNEHLGTDEDYITRSMISRYLNKELDGTQDLEEARRGEGSHGMAERSITIIDEAAETREEIARNKNRADLRLRLAGFMNPQYKDTRGQVNVQINNGQLHLDAMRQRVLTPSSTQPALPAAEGADYTFEETDGKTTA